MQWAKECDDLLSITSRNLHLYEHNVRAYHKQKSIYLRRTGHVINRPRES